MIIGDNMKKLIFILKNTVIGFKGKLAFNLIIIIALSIGLFMPMLFLAEGNYYLNYCSHSFYADAQGTAFIDGFRKIAPADALNEEFSKIDGVTDFAYNATHDVTIEKDNALFLSNVVGISERYTELTGYTLLDGRIMTADEITNNESVCVVSRIDSDFTNGWTIKVGDKFKINSKEYTVIGIVYDPIAYGTFLIPYNALEEMVGPKAEMQYLMFLRTAPDNVQNVLKENVVTNFLQKMSAAEYEAEWKRQLMIAFRRSSLPWLILLAFSVLNFILIIYGKFLETLYTWGVKSAVGETRLTVFGELFLQNLILILLAAIAPLIIIAVIMPQITTTDMLINGVWFLGVFALCIILALIITSVLYFALIGKKIPDMLKIG